MKINAIYSGKIYEKMMNASAGKRDDLYRYEMMKPFEYKWACINVPIKAARKGGYDVVMASDPTRKGGSFTERSGGVA